MKEVITQLNDTFQALEGQLLSASKSSQVFIERLEARAIERQRKNIFHLLGQRIKLLIDTPEEVSYFICFQIHIENVLTLRYGTH